MQTIIDALREVLGEPDFYKVLYGNNPTWDYGAMIEYIGGLLILCIVVSSVFRIIALLFKGRGNKI